MEIPHEVLAEEGIKTEWGIVPVADKEGLKMARSAANSEGNKGADYRYPALLTAPLKYVGNYFGNLRSLSCLDGIKIATHRFLTRNDNLFESF
jgi:hypothetical protein